MRAYIFLYVLSTKSMFYSSVLIKDVQKKAGLNLEKVIYLLGCHDTLAFKRLLISNHPVCDIFLFLNDYED